MANLGTATIQLNLDISQFKGGIAGIAPALQSVVGQAERTAVTGLGAAGKASGVAFGAGITGSIGAIPTALVQPVRGGAVASSFGSAGRDAGNKFESGLISSIGGAVGKIKNVGTQIGNSLKTSLQSVTQGIGQGIGQNISQGIMSGIGAAGGAILSTKNIGNYDAAVRQIKTLGVNSLEFEASAKKVTKALGDNSDIVTTLNSLYDVASSGFTKAADAQQILTAAVKLSTTSNSELEDVQRTMLGTLNAYGLGAEKAGEVSNKMFGAINAGVINGKELASTFGNVSGAAAAAGVSLDETLSLIAVATLKGIKAPEAVTGTRALIDSFSNLSKQGKDALNELGVRADSVTLKQKGVYAILKEIESKGATAEQTAAIFGSAEARKIVNSVKGADGASKFEASRKTINSTNIDKSYEDVSAGLIKQTEAAKNKLINLDVEMKKGAFGASMVSALGLINRGIDMFANALTSLNTAYQNLSPQQQGFIHIIGGGVVIIAGVTATIIAVSAAAAMLGGALSGGIAIIGAFATGLGSIAIAAAPIVIPLAAVGAAVFGLAKLFGATDSQAFVASLAAIGVGLAVLFGPAAIAAIGTGTTALITGFGGIAVAAGAALVPLLPWIAAAAGIAAALYGLYKVYEMFKPQIDKFVGGIVDGFRRTIAAALNWIGEVSKPFVELGKWYLSLQMASWKFTGALIQAWASMWMKIGQNTLNAGASIAQFIGSWTSKVWGLFFDVTKAVWSFWGGLWNQITGGTAKATSSVAGNIGNFGKTVLTAITSTVTGVIRAIESWLKSMGLIPKNADLVGIAITGFKTVVGLQFGGALGFVFKLKDGFINAFNVIVAKIKELIGWVQNLPKELEKAANALNVFSGAQPASPATNNSGFTPVISTGYTPGEGDVAMEGGQKDHKGRKLTKEMPAIATRSQSSGKGIPYDSIVEIRDPKSGKVTQARAVDRGSLQPGVDADLTTAVFKNLGIPVDSKGLPKQGKVPLEIRVVSTPSGKVEPSYDIGTHSGKNPYDNKGNFIGNFGKVIGGLFNFGQSLGTQMRGGSTIASPIAGKTIAQATANVDREGHGHFGAKRPGRKHMGEDYKSPEGTPVRAAFDGVARYEHGGREGAKVIVEGIAGDGITKLRAVYLHLAEESAKLFNGNAINVVAGQTIGAVGKTGQVYRDGSRTGSKTHLHLQTQINNVIVDPKEFLQKVAQLSKSTPTKSTNATIVTTAVAPSDPRQNRIDDANENLQKAESDLARVSSQANPASPKEIQSLTEKRDKAQKRLDRTMSEAAKKRGKDRAKSIKSAAEGEISAIENAIKLINSTAKNELAKVDGTTSDGKVAIAKIQSIQQSKLKELIPMIGLLRGKYADRPDFLTRLNKAETPINAAVTNSQIKKTASKLTQQTTITAPKLADASSPAQRKIDDAARELGEAKTNLSELQGRANPASADEIQNAKNIIKSKQTNYDRSIVDARNKRNTSRVKAAKKSAEDEVDEIQNQLEIIQSSARLDISKIDGATAQGKAQIAKVEVGRISKEKSLLPKIAALRAKYAKNQSLLNQLNDRESSIRENAKPKESSVKTKSEIEQLEQQIKTITDDTTAKNNLTDLAVARNKVSKQTGEIVKGERGKNEAAKLAALLPKIAQLKQKYTDPELKSQVLAIEAAIISKQKDSAATQSSLSESQKTSRIDTAKSLIETPIANNDRAKELVENKVLTGDTTRASADQANISNQIRYNSELQKSVILVKQLKKNSTDKEEIKAFDELIQRAARFNAETVSISRADGLATIKSSIDKQLSEQTIRTEEISNALAAGDISALEAQSQQLAIRKLYNEEIQKTLGALKYILSISKGDAIAPIEEQIRRVQKSNSETRAAEQEYSENITVEQFETLKQRVDNVVRVGEQRQTTVEQERINSPELITQERTLANILVIRQQTAAALTKSLPDIEAFRNAQTDPKIIEQANELIAKIAQIGTATKAAGDEAKKAAYETSVLGQVSKALTQTLETGLGDVFRSAFRGFSDLGSIIDGIVNKVADIGINALIGGLGSGGNAGTGILGTIGSLFGFKDGGEIRNYNMGGEIGAALSLASAYSTAMQREGAGAVPIVGKVGEEMLSIPNAKIYRQMVKSGDWDRFKNIYNYNTGGTLTVQGARQNTASQMATQSKSGGTSAGTVRVEVETRMIGGVEYATIDQLRESVTLAVQASEAKIGQNFSSTAYRQQYGLR